MLINTNLCHTLTLGAVMLGLTGCGGSEAPVAVTGTVTLNQRPVAYAMLQFQSLDDEQSQRAVVVKNGKFELPETLGLAAGDYNVCVLPYDPELEELSQVTKEQRLAILAARKKIPERYHQTNELTASISPDAPNELTFDLK